MTKESKDELGRMAQAILANNISGPLEKQLAKGTQIALQRIELLEDALRFYAATDGEIAMRALNGTTVDVGRSAKGGSQIPDQG